MTETQKRGMMFARVGNGMKDWIDFNKMKHCQNVLVTLLFNW